MTKKLLFATLLLLLVWQFFPIDKNNPPIDEALSFSSTVQLSESESLLLNNACMNCHSNVTTYPSYTRIQPVGWWTKGHVKAGRKKLNFSEWNSYDPNQKAHHLRECMEVLNEGRMPLKSYTWLHPESKLNKEQTDKLLELFIRLENI